jgi:hypothetical protein
MVEVREGYQALCSSCRRPVGAPMEDLPRARLTVNADGDLVMRMIVADGCLACGGTDVEIVVQPRRSA